MMKKSFFLFVFTLCLFSISAFSGTLWALEISNAPAVSEISLLQQRYVASLLPSDPEAIEQLREQSFKYAESIRADGTWSDISYGSDERSEWSATGHLNRTLLMAKSARILRSAGHADPELEDKIIRALRAWTDHDYRNPNWWWNEIGVPLLTGEIASLISPELPKDEMSIVIRIMKRSDWRRVPWTGANLTWGVTIEIIRGWLEQDSDTVAEGYNRLYQEIKIVKPGEEGIQPDYSFHQHGDQLYNGGYGLDYANDVGRFVTFAWGTHFQIPGDRMEIFSSYLLDGMQWMIFGDLIDYSATSREITRKGKVAVPKDWSAGPIAPVGAAYSFGNVIAMLAAEPTPRQKEFQAFAARLKGQAGPEGLTGNKQFWCSDFMTHRRRGFYTSVKMLSKRTLNGEIVNSEGRKSQHLSDGLNLLYQSGGEYRDIFAVWDWTKLPGTTAVQGTLEMEGSDSVHVRGKTSFAGGVSDGTYGMAAMDLARGQLTAKKAWIFLDDVYICLGTGIILTGDEAHDVATDVNQIRLHGDILTSQSPYPISPGTHTYKPGDLAWVYHDHVGYIFGPGSEISLSAGSQIGKWSEIGTGSSMEVTLPVFNLWIEHGRSPQAGTYRYMVLPGATPEQVAARAKNPSIDVLSNTEEIQAVYSKDLKLAAIAFRKPASLQTPVGRIGVNHSCLLLVRKVGHHWRVTAANPENEPLSLLVNLEDKHMTIELPDGNSAGSSITASISSTNP